MGTRERESKRQREKERVCGAGQVYPVGKLMEMTSKFVLGLMGVKVSRHSLKRAS